MVSVNKNKAVAIVGPTASGKSDLAVKLAKEFNGEIISADSRQIYKGLDLGSGKVTLFEMDDIPHHLLDIASPKRQELFTLAEYLQKARAKINEIFANGKVPFIVGGTGLYVSALVEGYQVPEVSPNKKLRSQLKEKTLGELQNIYKEIDPKGFEKLDIQNPRRLIRAIEVVKHTGKPYFETRKKIKPEFETLILGVDVEWENLKQRISERLQKRIDQGMLEETKHLLASGVSEKFLEKIGLDYKWMAKVALGKTSLQKAQKELLAEEIQFARRQLTWWRNKDVVWVKSLDEAEKEIKKYFK